jgi:uncharacterized protein (DUF2235 family)
VQILRFFAALAIAVFVSGCSTTQSISLAKQTPTKLISSVAQVTADGNSAQMDGHLEAALVKQGLTLRSKLPAGTTTAKDIDALVSYVDIWRWDVVMYMKNLTIRVNDAATGDLIAMAEWTESHFHQFRGDSGVKAVVEKLVADLMEKIRTPTNAPK